MRDMRVRAEARRLMAAGRSPRQVAFELGLPTTTVYRWRASLPTDQRPPAICWRCSSLGLTGRAATEYLYLFGRYLGDGHLVTSARIPVLRIYGCTDYPRMLGTIRQSITLVRGSPPAVLGAANTQRMVKIQSYWMHWPCLFPQHGPGRKHERRIELIDW